MAKPKAAKAAGVSDSLLLHQGAWKDDPLTAFMDWLAEQPALPGTTVPFRDSSRKTYRSTWQACLAAAKELGFSLEKPIEREQARAIAEKIAGKAGHKRKAAMLMSRIAAAASGHSEAPRAPVVGASQEKPTKFFVQAETEALCAAAAALPAGIEARLEALSCALFLGAGLKVSEALALSVNCVDWQNGSIRVPAGGRLIFPPPWAWSLIEERCGREGPMTRLLPHQSNPLLPCHPSSVFRAVRRLADAAGIPPGPRVSPQTMRNSRAAELFARGLTNQEVSTLMGFATERSAPRLRQAWKAALARPAGASPAPAKTAGQMGLDL